MSLQDGEPLEAGMSFLSLIPFMDWVKLGKLPKLARILGKVIERASESADFAKRATPYLKKLDGIIGNVLDSPTLTRCLPQSAIDELKSLRKQLDEFLAPRGPVKPGDKGMYGDLKGQKKTYGETERLDMDHRPSYAAQKKALENKLGRKLTPEEAKALRNQTPAVATPRAPHQQQSRTYGGRNTKNG